jgi:hypothetical protein
MQGLYLLPEQWYDQHGVVAWLNTVATSIDVRLRAGGSDAPSSCLRLLRLSLFWHMISLEWS